MINGYFLVVYEKTDKTLLFRLRYTPPDYKLGEYTSMNWRIIEIQQYYSKKNKFVKPEKFLLINQTSINKQINKNKRKEKIIDLLYNVFH